MSKVKQQQEGRAPFTRDEIVHETRLAALGLASMIAAYGAMSGAPDAAAKYLGTDFEQYGYENASDEELNRIPIEDHFLYRVVVDAYEYAYQVGSRGLNGAHLVEERAHEVAGILSGFPRSDSYGEPSPLDTLNPHKLRQVLETFMARFSLDYGGDLSVSDLALLANMSEATVRSSLSTEGIRTVVTRKGQPGVVPHGDAMTWLMGRRGFTPTAKFDGSTDIGETVYAIFAATNLDFVSALQKAMEAAQLDTAALAAKATVSEPWLMRLATRGENAEVDVPALQRIAAAMSAPEAMFAGKAVQDLLSRS